MVPKSNVLSTVDYTLGQIFKNLQKSDAVFSISCGLQIRDVFMAKYFEIFKSFTTGGFSPQSDTSMLYI